MNGHYYTVIMAGGVGSRFWPLSKQRYPKQFLDVLDTGKSLFQSTYERFLSLCPRENIYIVANKDYEQIIVSQIPGIDKNQVLLEPIPRNTAPCVAYAAHKIRQKDPDAVMVVAPSDHLILNENTFIASVEEAMNFASQHEVLITLGITPNRPDTGYGYIQMNEDHRHQNFFKVKSFTEKPNLELAKRFVESGEFLWNAGIFIWSVKSILNALHQYLPDVATCFNQDPEIYYSEQESEYMAKTYVTCPAISVDYGVMEKAENVYVLPGNFGWSDIGTWNSLFEYLEKDENNNAIKGKHVVTRNAHNCIINISDGKLLAVNNVDNMIIVESDDVILVANKSSEQDIRHIVNEIKSKYRERFI